MGASGHDGGSGTAPPDADALAEFSHSLAESFGAHTTVLGPSSNCRRRPPHGRVPHELVQTAQAAAMKEPQRLWQDSEEGRAPAHVNSSRSSRARQRAECDRAHRPQFRHDDRRPARRLRPGRQRTDDRGRAVPLGAALADPAPSTVDPGQARPRHPFAWDGGAAAARADLRAMPFLKRAGRVEVVTMVNGNRSTSDLPGFDVTRNLARHGIQAELKTLPRGDDVGSLILSYAADENADLWSWRIRHSRLREFVARRRDADDPVVDDAAGIHGALRKALDHDQIRRRRLGHGRWRSLLGRERIAAVTGFQRDLQDETLAVGGFSARPVERSRSCARGLPRSPEATSFWRPSISTLTRVAEHHRVLAGLGLGGAARRIDPNRIHRFRSVVARAGRARPAMKKCVSNRFGRPSA